MRGGLIESREDKLNVGSSGGLKGCFLEQTQQEENFQKSDVLFHAASARAELQPEKEQEKMVIGPFERKFETRQSLDFILNSTCIFLRL